MFGIGDKNKDAKEIAKKVESEYNSGSFNKNTLKLLAADVHGFVVRFDSGEEVPEDEINMMLAKYLEISAKMKAVENISPIKKREIRQCYAEIDSLVEEIRSDLANPLKYSVRYVDGALNNAVYKKVVA